MRKFAATLFFICLFLTSAPKVFAAGDFAFTLGEKTFPVSSDVLNTFNGQVTISPNLILNPSPENLDASLLKLIGQDKPEQPKLLTYNHNLKNIYAYISGLSQTINVPTIEPKLTIEEGKVKEFTPPQTGEELDVYKAAFDALTALEAGKNSAALTVNQTPPQNSLAQTNTLGINELIAQGVSNFSGSPNNRRHNIAVGVEKEKGILVGPGQEFSFNDNLGPVDGEHGFLPELVIKGKEGTIPEFGGGLCQVSSTTFRAAMAAGFPITQRRNHAYPVQYYSPQGTDATIYPGVIDLKFINDSPGTILIWPYEKDKNTLVFDFYGSKDDRKVTLQKPVVYDRQPDGAMKATWTREIFKNATTTTDTFKSVYQSPALFHHEQQFVSATGTPEGLKIPPA